MTRLITLFTGRWADLPFEEVYRLSGHLAGQAVRDHSIDDRHEAILPARIWGDPRQPTPGSLT